jgi:ribosomal protein S12
MYLSAPYLKLKEAVASGAVALGEEKIVFVAGINVVDTPGVAVNLHRILKAF